MERFACELRALRAASGEVPFSTMARHSSVSKSALAAAVAGYRLPSDRVLTEFVRCCGGDLRWWLNRLALAHAEATAPTPRRGEPDSTPGGRLVPRSITQAALPPAHALPFPLLHPAPPGPSRRRERPRRRGLAVLALVAFTVGWLAHLAAGPAAATGPTNASAALTNDCGPDHKTIRRKGAVWRDASEYGWRSLLCLLQCRSNWGQVTGPHSPKWRVYITVHRPAGDAAVQFPPNSDLGPGTVSSTLHTTAGCVYPGGERVDIWLYSSVPV
ncbi:hypothetical protein [Actinomadura rupiterrae]|uniref:hypothetical protein n=1 Tax=Actinomadura rupiterrae TaxID=559627 RepID=UPI0020A4F55C|nr:hypothetical protein [Actinomadura rupiterrae]MCP2341385.1 hypothetical protein [Actinomadura rupiterrae]